MTIDSAYLASALDIEDPDDLDAIYEALDRSDWKAEELLSELAGDRNWVEVSDTELANLEPVEQDTPQSPGKSDG